MAKLKLPRQIELGSRGRDVKALKRALREAGYVPKGVKLTNTFDADTDAAVRSFQGAKRLEVDGQVGPNTFKALLPHYDRYSRWLVRQVKPDVPSSTRQKIVAAAYVGYRNRDAIHYTQDGRRMEGVRNRIRIPKFPRYEDCSSFATWCYWATRAPDPNGLGYNGSGYTGTQIGQGKETSTPQPGDLVFYGTSHSRINHVAIYVGRGQVVSHGQESGPSLYPIDYSRGSLGGRQQVRSYLP